jgi:hypothetical protein
MSVNLNK